MLTNDEMARQIMTTDRSLGQKIRDIIGEMAQWFKETFGKAEPTIERAAKLWRDAYEETANAVKNGQKNIATDGDMKHSFKGYDKETGKGIYESNFPLGTPKQAKGEHILELIQNVWSKKPIELVINENGETRTIQAQFDPTYDADGNIPYDATKLMGGNRHGTSSDQRVTLDLADDYYQIASEATYNYSKDEEGKTSATHKDVKQWHYFVNDILFQEAGKKETAPYRVTINVKEKADGNFVYSFSAERQNEKLGTRQTLHADVNQSKNGEANTQPYIDSISNSDENVNGDNGAFSLKKSLEQENEMQRETITELRRQMSRTKDVQADPKAVKALSKDVLSEHSSLYDGEQLGAKLKDM